LILKYVLLITLPSQRCPFQRWECSSPDFVWGLQWRLRCYLCTLQLIFSSSTQWRLTFASLLIYSHFTYVSILVIKVKFYELRRVRCYYTNCIVIVYFAGCIWHLW
jgi:hypothetical protein